MGKRKRRTTVQKIAALLDQIADRLRDIPPNTDHWRAQNDRLEFYWRVGGLVQEYVNGGNDRTVVELAQRLHKHHNWLSAYRRFRQYFTEKEMKAAMRQRLTFRHIMALLPLENNSELRQQLQEKAAAGPHRKGEKPWSGLKLYREVRAVVRREAAKSKKTDGARKKPTQEESVAQRDIRNQAIRIDRRHLHAAATRCTNFATWVAELETTLEDTPAIDDTKRRNAARYLAAGIAKELTKLAEDILKGLGPRAKYLQPA